MDQERRIVQSLVQSVQKMMEEKIEQPNWYSTALAKLSEIFKEKSKQIQRVYSPVIQMSATPTAPAATHNAPHIHQRTLGPTVLACFHRIQGR